MDQQMRTGDAVKSAGITRRAAVGAAGGAAAALVASRSALTAGAAQATPAATPAAATNPAVASWPRVFREPAFQYQFLGALGSTYERAADVGELFAAAAEIRDRDYDSWYDVFHALGDRVRAIAEAGAVVGDRVSAREAWLRAASYYGQAYFFALGTKAPDRIVPTWEAHRASFDAFVALLDSPGEAVAIPYEGTTLPGYVLLVDDSGRPRPWLIMNNGSDGTASDMWAEGAAAGLRRGYNALVFDGPGQGAALWRQKLYFRPDWEKVVTPVVDWLLARPDVDPRRIAILGVSQGGYWVPRALAFEHRLAAAIADPGVVDVATSWTSQLPPGLLEELVNAPAEQQQQIAAAIDRGIAEGEAQSPAFRFTLAMRMAPFGTTTYSETLLRVAQYTLRDVVGRIRTPLLIAAPEGEAFWPGQSQELYDALPGSKELVRFTAAEGADLHCEPKALGLRAQRFFDWLDRTIGSSDAAPG